MGKDKKFSLDDIEDVEDIEEIDDIEDIEDIDDIDDIEEIDDIEDIDDIDDIEDIEEIDDIEDIEEIEEEIKKKETSKSKKSKKDVEEDLEEEVEEPKAKKAEKKPEKKEEKKPEKKEEKKPAKKEKDEEKVKEEKEHKKEEKTAKNDEKKKDKKAVKEEEPEEEEKGMSIFVKIAAVIVLIAIIILLLMKGCSKEEYTVKFDTNGGNAIAEEKVNADATVNKPSDPTKEGYIFAGWYIGDEEYDFSSKVTSDMTIEARWEKANNAKVDGVTLDQTSMSLKPGTEASFVVTVSPEDAKDKNVTWTSSNPAVATVDENGNVKALKNGTTTITVKTADGEFTATATVKVTSDVVSVTGVTAPSEITVNVNKTATIKATVAPTNATNKGVTYESSDPKVATVSANGVVTGKKAGTATITVTTKDGKKTATTKVTVKDVKVTGVTASNVTVTINKTAQLKATVSPADATEKGVTYKVADSTIATVSASGVVTGKKVGTTTVTVTTKDGAKTATATITVKDVVRVTGVTAKIDKSKIYINETAKVTATVTPTNAVDKTVTYKSSNTAVATVSSTGAVKGVGEGTATITVTTKDGAKTAQVTITVEKKPVLHNFTYSFTKTYKDESGAINAYDITFSDSAGPISGQIKITAPFTTRAGSSTTIKINASQHDSITGNVTIEVGGVTYTAKRK